MDIAGRKELFLVTKPFKARKMTACHVQMLSYFCPSALRKRSAATCRRRLAQWARDLS